LKELVFSHSDVIANGSARSQFYFQPFKTPFVLTGWQRSLILLGLSKMGRI